MNNPNGGLKNKETPPAEGRKDDLTCGLIMPISALDGLSSDHWAEVKGIIVEAVESIGPSPRFVPRLVSDADEIGVIQKRIIQNVYNSTIVVCDVSGKNPNVMFELGLRLAFDKPTVIIKDDKTDYSFDTSVIEHLHYPRDLRFTKIVEFKKQLTEKILNTYKACLADTAHSPFLKSFGQFQVATLTQSEVSPDKVMLEMLSEMQRDMQVMARRIGPIQAQPSQSGNDARPDAKTRAALLDAAMEYLAGEPTTLDPEGPISNDVAMRVARMVSNAGPIQKSDVDYALRRVATIIKK